MHNKILLIIFAALLLLSIALFRFKDRLLAEQVDLCNPSVQAMWAFPCIGESKLPEGAYKPNCDRLSDIQEMCYNYEVYLVTPVVGVPFLDRNTR